MSRWSDEEEHLLRLLLPTNSYQEIAEEFSRRVDATLPGFRTGRSPDAIRRKCEREELTPDSLEDYVSPVERKWDQIEKMGERYRLERETVNTGLISKANIARKILSISDIHFPFARTDLLESIVEEHADADVCVVAGDILDGYIWSTFSKSKNVAAHHEYMMGFELIRNLRETFPMVAVISGNHDVRLAKGLGRAGFTRDQTNVLGLDLLARISNGEELDEFGRLVRKHDFSNVVYQQPESWFVQIGKTIFAHPHGWKDGPGGTVYKLDQIFADRFGTKYYDSIVIGHTHKLFKGIYHNRMLIEQGSLSARQDYEHKPDLKFTHAMNGYSVIYQDQNGNTCFNMSGPIYLGSELPPKRPIL